MNVIITGASKGIGKAIATIFAANGYDLFLCSRNEVALYKAMEELQTRFPSITIKAKAFDLSKQAKEFGQWILAQDIEIDVLVNNAGLFEPGSVYNEPEGTLESQVQTNVYSAYHLTRTLLQAMMKRKAGHIFNICSIASFQAYKNGGAYSISKFAMDGFNKNLREEMKEYGIKVTAVYPGAVLTDSWGDYDNSKHRIMEAADVAKIIFAASQLSAGACVEEIVMRPQLGDL
ncbi:SDR family NAD(P)-dependent oxidoreductase [Ferruginibacter sp. SUN106]|uniref:SDR family NAD(P)-dependent oxidoreductase n=1 Tax=Ferruginibacter sp. SUN106 TaxID=2978348 RepID=UPI003D35FE6D